MGTVESLPGRKAWTWPLASN